MADIVDGQFSDADERDEHVQHHVATSKNLSSQNNVENAEGDQLLNDDNEYYDGDSDESYFYEDVEERTESSRNSQRSFQSNYKSVGHFQPSKAIFGKHLDKINVGPCKDAKRIDQIEQGDAGIGKGGSTHKKDKQDRATVEKVLDPRTRMILFKLLNKGLMDEINGCVSTGKEANVYHATGKNGEDLAIKIYQTSILNFKDRDKYVSGEHRFRHGYCKKNPRKMVRTWAEKEMRNLSRLNSAGINCPKPILLKGHVLLMSFIGKNGIAAAKLKEVELSESKARELYLDCVIMMRKLFWDCELVHADLSEYNILYHEGKLCVIDVSQAIERHNPHALDFLRADCTNCTDFFKRQKVCTMSVKELFDFITDSTINSENMDRYLEKAEEIALSRSNNELTNEDLVNDKVFQQIYIPQRLDEVNHFERDIQEAKVGPNSEMLYQTITGMKPDLSGPQMKPTILEDDSDKENSDNESDKENSEESESEEDNDDDEETKPKKKNDSKRPRNLSPNSRRERKRDIKEAQREKRKTKVKKHVKRRMEKLAKQVKKH
ncbi:Serine/threonine-protein kinase RIO1 [Chamberlinius hualienensis]